jgi:hypothetical protein
MHVNLSRPITRLAGVACLGLSSIFADEDKVTPLMLPQNSMAIHSTVVMHEGEFGSNPMMELHSANLKLQTIPLGNWHVENATNGAFLYRNRIDPEVNISMKAYDANAIPKPLDEKTMLRILEGKKQSRQWLNVDSGKTPENFVNYNHLNNIADQPYRMILLNYAPVEAPDQSRTEVSYYFEIGASTWVATLNCDSTKFAGFAENLRVFLYNLMVIQ